MTRPAKRQAAGASDVQLSSPTGADLLQAVQEIVPVLQSHAAETEQNRRLPDAVVEALVGAGLHRAYQPARYGGYQLDFAFQVDLGAALGAGCASAAWCGMFYAQHPLVVGMMPPEAQDEVWRQSQDTLIANAFFTPGSACTAVDDGYLLDGTWTISSGVDHCGWNNLNVMVPQEDGPPEHRFMLVPESDYRVLDDWRATGLAGTGSNSIVLSDVFVPAYRTLRTVDCRGGPTPGSAVNDSYLYRLPLMATFPVGPATIAPGIAGGILQAIYDGMRTRQSAAGVRVADLPTAHLRLSEAGAMIAAAKALMQHDCAEIDAMGAAGKTPPLARRAAYRRDWAYAVELCRQAAGKLLPLQGAQGLAEGNTAQRLWRDIHAVSAHAALTWDIQGQHEARARLELPLSDSRI